MAEWYVAQTSELQEGGKKVIEVEGNKIGVYRKNGKLYAYKNFCPHQGGPACEGIMVGKVEAVLAGDKTLVKERFSDTVTHMVCPWHGWEYNLETGVSVSDRKVSLKKYEVVEQGGAVYVIV